MPSYKLYYLNAKGLGEPLRLILTYANQPFEDIRLNSLDEVRQRKDEFPFEKVPVLEIDNKVKIPQSLTIARYLAKQFKLNGKDDIEAAHIDSIANLFLDFHISIRPFTRCIAGYEQGDVETLTKTVLVPGILQYIPMFEKLLAQSGSGFFAKSGISYVDFFLCELVNSFGLKMPELFAQFKLLNAHVEHVYALPTLQNYIKTRPQTKF